MDNYQRLTNNLRDNISSTLFFIDAIPYMNWISRLVDEYRSIILSNKNNNFFLSLDKTYLPIDKIILISREIIGSIDSRYADKFDNCLALNLINISKSNTKNSTGNIIIGYPGTKNSNIKINLYLENTYNDILTLVHEFIHYVATCDKTISRNYMLLTEFFSIYYEEYALDYLKYNNALERLNNNKRIYATYINANDYLLNEENYLKIIKSFYEDGEVNKQSLYNRYGYDFDYSVDLLLKRNIVSLKNHRSFPYIIGTILAYYSLKRVNPNDIKNCLDRINMEDNTDFTSFIIFLKQASISLDEVKIEDLIEPTREVVTEKLEESKVLIK